MNKLLIISFLLLGSTVFGQKIKIDGDLATVDGADYIYYLKTNMANNASVKGLAADHEEMFLTYLSYNDPAEVSKSNPQGAVRWIEVNFLDLGIKCEIPSNTHKAVVRLLYENNIFVDGKVDPEAARRFVAKYGLRYTENRTNGNVNIIINN